MPVEKTLILLKPDTLQRGLVGKIISKIEERELQIVGMKMIQLDQKKCAQIYHDVKKENYYPQLEKFMTCAPIIAIVLKGVDVAKVVQNMRGDTDSIAALQKTLRADYSLSSQYNILHASDSAQIAKKEIEILFEAGEIREWTGIIEKFTAEKDEK